MDDPTGQDVNPGNPAESNLAAFFEINAAEVVDVAKKGLIIRASLLESAPKLKGFWHSETGLNKATITGRSLVDTIFYN
jgi:hypothetical protein